jgi:enoyl-CoA hydratase/carnithine racemase
MSYQCSAEDNIVVFRFIQGRTNPISTATLEGLNQAIQKVNETEELKGLIMTGQGRFFSSGFDLETFTSFKETSEILKWFEFQEEVMYNLFTCKKPVIAAVNGHATAAGLIVSMAADYRIVIDSPKIKLGMTEITIGLPLTPAEGEIMRFGLDSNKNFRDLIFSGQLINPAETVQRGIFDELAADETALMAKAQEKICALIDTPGRPFIMLKTLHRKHSADHIKESNNWYDWDAFARAFLDETVLASLNRIKASMAK